MNDSNARTIRPADPANAPVGLGLSQWFVVGVQPLLSPLFLVVFHFKNWWTRHLRVASFKRLSVSWALVMSEGVRA
jgi:hypothetical protein